jgi:hypothetical protein
LANQFDWRKEIKFKQRANSLGTRLMKSTVRRNAGIVDEDVETSEFIARSIDRALTGFWICDITDDENRSALERLDFTGDFFESILSAGDEDQIDASASKFDRQCSANPARCASDESAAIGEWAVGHAVTSRLTRSASLRQAQGRQRRG